MKVAKLLLNSKRATNLVMGMTSLKGYLKSKTKKGAHGPFLHQLNLNLI